ncbi:Bgt-20199, partial [Blumeria graminis f. sp. tritici]
EISLVLIIVTFIFIVIGFQTLIAFNFSNKNYQAPFLSPANPLAPFAPVPSSEEPSPSTIPSAPAHSRTRLLLFLTFLPDALAPLEIKTSLPPLPPLTLPESSVLATASTQAYN